MTVALILTIASALLGFATGLFLRVWAMVPISAMIAILSAIALQARGFGFVGGVSIAIGCLVISQLAYVATSLVLSGSSEAEDLAKEIDCSPNGSGEHDVRSEDE